MTVRETAVGQARPRAPQPEEALRRVLDDLNDADLVARPGRQPGTREKILDAAVEIFAARGFGSTTMRDLASAVGIKAPGLYAHFASKEAILSQAVLRALAGFLDYVTQPIGGDSAARLLEETVRRHVRYQLEHLSATRANDLLLGSGSLGEFLPPEDFERVLGVQRSYLRLVRARVAAAVPAEVQLDSGVAARAVINMCDLVTSWYRPAGEMTVEDVADQYWFLVQGMLRLDRSCAGVQGAT